MLLGGNLRHEAYSRVMAWTTVWRRFSFGTSNAVGYGGFEGVTLAYGETLTRTYWTWQCLGAFAQSTQPIGSLVARAGLLLAVPNSAPEQLPTPISQPDADWVDIATPPWAVQIATSTNVDWVVEAHTGEQDAKSQRKVSGDEADSMSVYVMWELGAGTFPGETLTLAYTATLDALVLLPA